MSHIVRSIDCHDPGYIPGSCHVFLEGTDISSECYRVDILDDGIIMAHCYVRKNGEFVIRDGSREVEKIVRQGKGYVAWEGGAGMLISGGEPLSST